MSAFCSDDGVPSSRRRRTRSGTKACREATFRYWMQQLRQHIFHPYSANARRNLQCLALSQQPAISHALRFSSGESQSSRPLSPAISHFPRLPTQAMQRGGHEGHFVGVRGLESKTIQLKSSEHAETARIAAWDTSASLAAASRCSNLSKKTL